jgi:hypothetical protein
MLNTCGDGDVDLRERSAQRQSGVNCPEGIVFVGDRRPEQR